MKVYNLINGMYLFYPIPLKKISTMIEHKRDHATKLV